jgi:uncharacterized protein with von Willebrand factor type A (vWA) domain
MEPQEIEAAKDVAREIGIRFAARSSRRERHARRGRVDVRRTIRSSLGHGGAMIDIEHRGRRPGKPRLVALCDVSGSVSVATDLLLGIVAGAEGSFARVTRLVYVDRPIEAAYENGHILPDSGLDLYARSDLGAVLVELERRFADLIDPATVLLVLGDARNNRRPPRAEVLRRLSERARAVVWAVPEPRARWNTGDSALAAYAPYCALVVEATSLGALVAALRRAERA